MDAEEYIEQYGSMLSESDKRYIRTFGTPVGRDAPGRNPSTPSIQIADEDSRSRADRLDREAGW
jgi:hypothetical protein